MFRLARLATPFAVLSLMAVLVPTISADNPLEKQYPPESRCSNPGRTLSDVIAIQNSSEADATNEFQDYSALGDGVSASESQFKSIRATLIGLVACHNHGETYKFLGLFSDRFIQLREGTLDFPLAPLPEDERIAFIGIEYVRIFDDGRAGAFLIYDNPKAPSPAEAVYVLLVEVDGRWLIDDYPSEFSVEYYVDGEPVEPGTIFYATPIAG